MHGAKSSIRFGALAVLVFLLVFLLPLSVYKFDFSTFIGAGDQFVARSAVPIPIVVRKNSGGYDGQFYFRLALNPDARQQTENGVTFDNAPWRMQRIMYSAIVHAVSSFDLRYVPFFLVAVNFASLFCVGFFARTIALQAHLPAWFAIAIMAWPGYLITLEHDTTEIVAVAFLAAAIAALLARQYVAYAVLAALATLTRETAILVFGGVFAVHGLDWLVAAFRSRTPVWGRAGRAFCCLLALLPFLAWRFFLTLRWGMSPGAAGSTLLGWPFRGLIERVAECLQYWRDHAPLPFASKLETGLVVLTLVAFVAVIALVLARLRQVRAWDVRITGLVVGWALVATLHACLNVVGWDHMTGYLRGCSEFWFVSMLLVALSGFKPTRIQAIGGLGFAAIVALGNLS
jgi:hypothetical protein